MKKCSLFLLFFVFLQYNAVADYGNCIIYELKFYLKDGSIFKGSLEVFGEDEMAYLDESGFNEYTSDEGIMVLIDKLISHNYLSHGRYETLDVQDLSNKILVYKSLEELELKKIGTKYVANIFNTTYGFALEKSTLLLDTSDIENIIFWKAKNSARDWISSPIIVTSKNMIERVKNDQYWNRFTMTTHPENDSTIFLKDYFGGGYDLINYNSNINTPELQRLALLKLKPLWGKHYTENIIAKYKLKKTSFSTHDAWSNALYKHYQIHFNEICRWFAKKGILVVEIWETC